MANAPIVGLNYNDRYEIAVSNSDRDECVKLDDNTYVYPTMSHQKPMISDVVTKSGNYRPSLIKEKAAKKPLIEMDALISRYDSSLDL
jgi:hypothetical protein